MFVAVLVHYSESIVYQNGSTILCEHTDIRTVLGAVEALRSMVHTEIQSLGNLADTVQQSDSSQQLQDQLTGNISHITLRLDELKVSVDSQLLSLQSELTAAKTSLQSQVSTKEEKSHKQNRGY